MPLGPFKLRPVLVVVGVCAFLVAAGPLRAQNTQTLIFPQIAVGGGFQTVLTLIHSDERSTAAASGTLRFFNPDGSARIVNSDELGVNSAFAVTVPYQGVRVVTLDSTDPVAVGMGRYDGNGVAVEGFATFRNGTALVGGLAAEVTRVGWVPLETSPGFRTGVAITNPGGSPVYLDLAIRNPDGSFVAASSPAELNPLSPNGHYARFTGPEMGFSSNLPANGTLEIAVNGPGNFAALALLLANGLMSSSSVITGRVNTPVIFPQIVDGGGFTTITRMFNAGASVFSGTMSYYNPNGTPRTITLAGRGTGSAFPILIPPRGTAVLATTGTDPVASVGMARIESEIAVGGVSTIFQGTTHIGVPPATPMRSGRIAIDTVNGNTGFALAGGGGSAASLSLTLQDRNGGGAQTVTPPGLNPLASNGQVARFVNQVGFVGTDNRPDSSMRVEATGGTFAPLVLVQSNGGVFSSGGIGRQVLLDPVDDWAGAYFGRWNDTTSGNSGSLTLTISVDAPSETATFTMNLNGGVFGDVDPPQETFTAPLTFDGYRVTTTSVLFGDWSLLARHDGTISIRAPDVPSALATTFSMDGQFDGASFTGTYKVGSPSGPPVVGTWIASGPR